MVRGRVGNTKYIETFVIPLDKLHKALQEKIRALHTEEAFNGLFDLSIASKTSSEKKNSSSKPETNESLLVRDQNYMTDGVGALNQELQYGFALPSPSVVSHCHPTTECKI
ncbi:hypothetical protein TNCV_499291 [Trichonephila clavipes]|nr:hypothetical protein TNCV_499291 [Trichonephila clavipes]